jgi:hypothetical protein
MLKGNSKRRDIHLSALVDPIFWSVPIHWGGGMLVRLLKVLPILLLKVFLMEECFVGVGIYPVAAT